ncbi:MAG TPA: pilus assembly protein [Thiotrichales bacterium]|nr:pilus assembly protein [Thiotrichales bacterium]
MSILPPRMSGRQRGQGMSEYLIIVALIAVAAIGVVGFFGESISNQMAAMSQEIAGQDGSDEVGIAIDRANSASSTARVEKTLANYAQENGK